MVRVLGSGESYEEAGGQFKKWGIEPQQFEHCVIVTLCVKHCVIVNNVIMCNSAKNFFANFSQQQ